MEALVTDALAVAVPPYRPAARAGWTLIAAFLLGACGDGRTPLVVYSPHGRELLTLVEERFEAENPTVDLRWLDMGSQDALDRVRSERANPQADVWFGGPSSLFQRAAEDSLLEAFRPTWADAIPARSRGPAALYHAAYETPAILAWNSEVLSAETAPADWDDVLAPAWDDRIVIRDPLASGTMRAIFGMIMQRSLRQTGDTAWGWQWLRRLDARTREYVLNPALLHQKLIRREGVLTLWDLPDILVEQAKGQPFGYTFPSSGTPVIEDAIAIVRGTRQRAVAERFVEWVGTPEAQLLAAWDVWRLPARLDLPADSLPDWVKDVRARMVVEPIDWALLGERGPAWMTYWDRHVRGAGAPAR